MALELVILPSTRHLKPLQQASMQKKPYCPHLFYLYDLLLVTKYIKISWFSGLNSQTNFSGSLLFLIDFFLIIICSSLMLFFRIVRNRAWIAIPIFP